MDGREDVSSGCCFCFDLLKPSTPLSPLLLLLLLLLDCLSGTSASVSLDDDDIVTDKGAPPFSQLHIPASQSRAARDAVANMIVPKSIAIANVEVVASRVGECIRCR